MELKHMKQQALVNRKLLAELYDELASAKQIKRKADENGRTATEYFWHNELKVIRAKIAKLVVLQKALKSDIQNELVMDRHIRGMQKAITEWRVG